MLHYVASQTREQSGRQVRRRRKIVAKRSAKVDDLQPNLFEEAPESAEVPTVSGANLPANFPASWAAAIGAEFDKPYFAKLRQFIVDERKAFDVLPPAASVFNAFRATPLEDVRVVILGQDPYPTPGHAHGLCFSVRPKVGLPASLRNIYRELHDDLGIPPVSHGYLDNWATQGVLMLNAVLTVRAGVRNSHKGKGWEAFTDAVVAAVNALPRRVVFVLWGSDAKKKAAGVNETKHTVIRGIHPSPMSAETGFFGSKPFSKVNAALEASGQAAIDWRLPASVG